MNDSAKMSDIAYHQYNGPVNGTIAYDGTDNYIGEPVYATPDMEPVPSEMEAKSPTTEELNAKLKSDIKGYKEMLRMGEDESMRLSMQHDRDQRLVAEVVGLLYTLIETSTNMLGITKSNLDKIIEKMNMERGY